MKKRYFTCRQIVSRTLTTLCFFLLSSFFLSFTMLCHRFIWSISSERQAPTTTVSCEFSVVFFTCDSIRQISSSTKFDKEIPEPQNRFLEVSKSPKFLKKNLNAESQSRCIPRWTVIALGLVQCNLKNVSSGCAGRKKGTCTVLLKL